MVAYAFYSRFKITRANTLTTECGLNAKGNLRCPTHCGAVAVAVALSPLLIRYVHVLIDSIREHLESKIKSTSNALRNVLV